MSHLLKYSLGTVCGPVTLKQTTNDALEAFVPHQGDVQKREHDQRGAALHKNIPDRYKRGRGVQQQDVSFAGAIHQRPPPQPKPKPKAQPKPMAGVPPLPKPPAPSLPGSNFHKVWDDDDENYLYEGDDFHSRFEVSVNSNDSSIPVDMLDQDALVDFHASCFAKWQDFVGVRG